MSTSIVSEVPAASPEVALRHYRSLLALETDCWDVHHAVANGKKDFVLLDVRSSEKYAAGHVPTAINIPVGKLTAAKLADFPATALLVVYCAGPHCNGADRAAIRLAKLGRPVKKMIGGITGWLDEGFDLVTETVLPRQP
jgi:rhodanese-related sulfurtransferase